MASEKQQISIRVQPAIYEKFKVICEINNRSISQQTEFLMKQVIENYESEHGKISLLIQQNNNAGMISNNLKMNNLEMSRS